MFAKKKKVVESTVTHSIITPLPLVEARRRLMSYLRLLGYEQVSVKPTIYERPAEYKYLLLFSPRGIQTRLQVDMWREADGDTVITIETEPIYNPKRITLYEADWDFWRAEIAGLEAAIVDDEVVTGHTHKAAFRAAAFGGLITLAAMAAILVPLVLVGLYIISRITQGAILL